MGKGIFVFRVLVLLFSQRNSGIVSVFFLKEKLWFLVI
ncbi:hypothetical protein P872_18940 [Rhodonellum psychrophilum GCM71 = DSM 17998]|uniref:Uncharacterized protein n=1 Tax=Rhodonellum psychrophilum GCM71 = DSM 17998 TaxID=1123057 RepID=U5C012_9BACT|nr:hypothetical protein P872_18940 [Rhodonellum psychrophilum GCM71 = DSM 17998]